MISMSQIEFVLKRPLYLFVGSLLLYILIEIIGNPILSFIKFIPGVMIFCILPGFVLSQRLLPLDFRNIGTAILLGICANVILIQFLFILQITTGLSIPLVFPAIITNTIIVGLGTFKTSHEDMDILTKMQIAFSSRRNLLIVGMLALTTRVFLAFFTTGSISSDAALFSDYARNIVNGQFYSNTKDYSVFSLGPSIDFIVHQGFSYVFAVSWLIMPGTISGPIFILLLVGVVLVVPIYELGNHFFGSEAAIAIGFLYALHPLFIYHSVVAYGPEIITLLLLCYGVLFLLKDTKKNEVIVLTGFLFGLVEVIWYANFYLLCVVLPLITYPFGEKRRLATFAFYLLCGLALVGRLFHKNLVIFFLSWAILLVCAFVFDRQEKFAHVFKFTYLFVPIFIIITFWRLPLQLNLFLGEAIPVATSEPFLSLITTFNRTFVIDFVLYSILQATPGVVLIAIYTISRKNLRTSGRIFLISGIFGTAGTFLVFHNIFSSVRLDYLLWDSRYFLFVSLMMLIAIGPVVKALFTKEREVREHRSVQLFIVEEKKIVAIVLIVLIGFIPLYLAIPQGVSNLTIREHNGWIGIDDIVDLTDESDVFLVKRNREFSWYTGRGSVPLEFEDRYLSDAAASEIIMEYTRSSKIDYLIIDNYTVARWNTLMSLYVDDYSIGQQVILNHSRITSSNLSVIDSVYSLTLVHETEPDSSGNYIRMFSFSKADYEKYREVSLLDSGWSASEEGLIVNVSSMARLVVGENKTFTNTLRNTEFDLNLSVSPGFILFDIEEYNATVWRVSIWNSEGEFITYAWEFKDGLYSAITGSRTIGDLRIMIEGLSGAYVTVKSISLWRAIPP